MTAVAQPALPYMPPAPGRRCSVCGGARAQPFPATVVTYVMARQRWVKIGKSKHPKTRYKELRSLKRQRYILCPPEMDRAQQLTILFTIDGDIEHELHERFADLHAHGEWFRRDGAIVEWISRYWLPSWGATLL